jgi:hypothetical protein
MGEAAGIAAELDLVEQLSAANAPFCPTARQIIEEIIGRAGLWRCGAALWRRGEFQPFPDAARSEPGLSGDVADRGSGVAQVSSQAFANTIAPSAASVSLNRISLTTATSRIGASRRASIGLVDRPPAGPGWLHALALRRFAVYLPTRR